ncbi:nicotinamide riboside kinase [[Candida] railenensis]|uniref:Nicotinamide riboside kinase n=1 Tax=[Candida] railenensis TaxID=45579 RepID=A0A9P0VW17_9ASCO|nr:nicotinamide riboside kinase [[Candida] railenensis]
MKLVAISGPSSSGKTTVASALHKLFKNSLLIHLDDFYLPDDQIPIDPVKKTENWDCPEAVNFEKFIKCIKDLKSNGTIEERPTYEGEVELKLTEDELATFEQEVSQYSEEQIVFVEGFMLFHDPDIIKLFDINLFFYASYETLKNRRESRQGYNTIAGFWVDPPNYFSNIVWPEFEKNHKYLFNNEDVNDTLTKYALDDLNIQPFKNENDSKLKDLIQWSLDQIIN